MIAALELRGSVLTWRVNVIGGAGKISICAEVISGEKFREKAN
jgi:hypothetical protein